MKFLRLTLIFWFAIAQAALAQNATFEPGTYITEKGWGDLSIKPAKNGAQDFSIITVGSNTHTCTLEGKIRGGRARIDSGESDKPCLVTFILKGKDIDVDSPTMDACRTFCGVRAGFANLYIKPSAACMPQAQKQARKKFKALYDQKDYAKALATLEPLLGECGKLLHWLDAAWIRNDLAITLYKLGNFSACQAVLQPLAADAALSDDELRGNYPPVDAGMYLPAIRATRTNLRLCKANSK